MSFITLLLLSFGLSMDAFAVSVSNGMCYGKLKIKTTLIMAGTFGFFQGFMPLMGYVLGLTFSELIDSVDHWIAFFILLALGLHMIYEAAKDYFAAKDECKTNVCTNKSIFFQGIATSIDAFAAGVGFAVIDANIFFAVSTIAVITFFSSLAGIYIGRKFRGVIKSYAELLGAVILIGIGIKLLIDGLV